MTLPVLLAIASVLIDPAPAPRPRLTDDSVVVKTSYIVEKISGSRTVPAELTADSVVVEKGSRRLALYHQGTLLRSYGVALGKNPVGDKVARGDFRTPEGLFRIETRNPNSKFYRSLRISYPDIRHQLRADSLGLSPGGDIMIHGLPKGKERIGAQHRKTDWTEGCIALTNQEIDELWRLVPDGVPIHIKP